MKSFILSLYFFLGTALLPITAVAQHRYIDSLYSVLKTEKEDTNKLNTLDKITKALYEQGNYKSTDSTANIELALALKLNLKIDIAIAYDMVGKSCTAVDKYIEALKNYTEALKTSKATDRKDIEATVYADIGIVYENEGNYPEALKNQLEALKIREQMNDSLHIDIICGNIGNIYNNEANYTDALRYKQRSLEIAQNIKDSLGIAYALGDMGVIYDSQKEFDKSLECQQKGLKISTLLHDKQGMGNALVNIGFVYYALKDYSKSLVYTKQGLDIYKAMDSKYLMSYAYANIGSDFTRLKNYSEAQTYLDSSLTIAKQINEKEMLKSTYLELAVLDSTIGKDKEALVNYKLSVQYADSLKNDENTKKIVSEEMNYEFDKKQAIEKIEQDRKDTIVNDNSKRQKLVILFMALIALAIAVIAIVIFRSLRITRKQKQLIEQQKLIVEEQKLEVEEQKLIVEHQKAIVDEKNKDITDSIHYASRIQRALLTTDDYISKRLSEYFILFKPRDIVSGDFYWANEVETNKGKRFLVCAGDCTGHGVPGAFMSLLNISLLNEVNIEKKINDPALILNDVREHIIKALNPEGLSSGSQDGMDCILCSFDLTSYMLSFACANNPLWVIRNGECIESKADKMPVGIQEGYKPFTPQTIQLQKGDEVYIFTDGYADQFGGPKGKKFKYKAFQELLVANTHKPMAEIKSILAEAIENWKGDLEQVDDILVVGIRI